MSSGRRRRPEDIYFEQMRPGASDEGFSIMLLLGTAVFVIVALISLPVIESMVVDPMLRWYFLLVALALCGAALLRAVHPKEGHTAAVNWALQSTWTEKEKSDREVGMLADAMAGSLLDQMQAWIELREMLVRRFMLMRCLSRVEAEAALSDPVAAREELKDEDLVWLLGNDFKRDVALPSRSGREGAAPMEDFTSRFTRLLGKLEALR